jgi:hypothetical protein
MRIWTLATIGALTLWSAIATAHAATLGGTIDSARATVEAANMIDKVAYRRCWWRQGVRYCRRYRSAYYPYQQYYSGSPIGIIIGIR